MGWNTVTCLGPSVGLVVLDTRAERTQESIIRPVSWAM